MRSTAKYCSPSCRVKACNARKNGDSPAVQAAPAAGRDDSSQPVSALAIFGEGPVQAATKKELEDAGRLNTALGQAAVALAIWLDSPGCSSPSSVAKELRATLTEATKGVSRATAPEQHKDELAQRRAKRGA